MTAGPRGLPQILAAPTPDNEANPQSPVTGTPQDRPPLSPPGIPSRTTTVSRYYSGAMPTAAALDLGLHSTIPRSDGSPVGRQVDWDGARRPTFRLTPQPWSEGLYIESEI